MDDAEIRTVSRRWHLDVPQIISRSGEATVAFARSLVTDDEVVVKVVVRRAGYEQEVLGLKAWNGLSAARLLACDHQRQALLIERLTPGHPLWTLGSGGAAAEMVALLPRLWRQPVAGAPSLTSQARAWQSVIIGAAEGLVREVGHNFVHESTAALERRHRATAEPVLLSTDLHAENVIAGRRDEWLAIDPKPSVGDRSFSVAPVVRSYLLGTDPADLLQRFEIVACGLDLDRTAARDWIVGFSAFRAVTAPSPQQRRTDLAIATAALEW